MARSWPSNPTTPRIIAGEPERGAGHAAFGEYPCPRPRRVLLLEPERATRKASRLPRGIPTGQILWIAKAQEDAKTARDILLGHPESCMGSITKPGVFMLRFVGNATPIYQVDIVTLRDRVLGVGLRF